MVDIRRVRKVRLVGVRDPEYRRFGAERRAEKDHGGPKRPPSASSRAGSIIEEAVRSRLKRRPGFIDERVVAYEERFGPYAYRPQYRELDGVLADGSGPRVVYEVKSGVSPKGWRAQLDDALELLGTRYRNVGAVVVWAPTGPVEGDPEWWSDAFDAVPEPGEVLCVRLDAAELWREVGADPALWGALQREREQPVVASPRPPSEVIAGPSVAGETALAAALARARRPG